MAAFRMAAARWLKVLPADLRKIVVHDSRAATARQRRLSESDEAKELKEGRDKYKVKVTHPVLAPFKKATAPTRAEIARAFPQFAAGLARDAQGR